MPWAAATATAGIDLDTLFFLAVIVVTVGYLTLCAVWPFKPCRRCHGTGRHRGPFGGVRLCHRCDNTGLRLRIGRRLWNSARRLYRDINHTTRGRELERARNRYRYRQP